MRTLIPAMVAWFAAAQNPVLTSARATKALQEMSDDEYAVTLAEYNATLVSETSIGGYKHAEQLIVDARIVDITALGGTNEGASAVAVVTASGKPMSFVCTNKQVGDADKKSFGLAVGGFAKFTLEERIEKKTQYLDKDTDRIKYHEKSGFGFINAQKLDAESFMLAGLNVNSNPAVQNALLQVHLAKINAGLVS